VGQYCRICGEEVALRFDARAAAWYSVCPNCGASMRLEGAPTPGRPGEEPGGRAEAPRRALGLSWGGRRP
jgi:hypothetical protein